MRGVLALTVVFLGLLGTGGPALGQEPLPPPYVPEGVLLPGPSAPHFYAPYPPYSTYRVSRYAHWQYLGVTSMGQFRPRVIWQNDHAFYLYNGAPYPWPSVHTLEFMPYARD